MIRVEFTIEPFVEGRPGAHVHAALEAARAFGVEVEFGPFASSCEIDDGRAGSVVRDVVHAALDNGATHVDVHVERLP